MYETDVVYETDNVHEEVSLMRYDNENLIIWTN